MQTVRRHYVDVSFGQVHYREAGSNPAKAPLVMIPSSASSSRMLLPLLTALSAQRRVIALDPPGNGESDPLSHARPEMEDFAVAMWETLDALQIDRFDFYGTHFGSRLGTELAITRPDRVRKLILDGDAFLPQPLLDEMIDKVAPVLVPDLDGLYLAQAWHYIRDYYLFFPWFMRDADHRRSTGMPAADVVHEKLMEVLRNGRTYSLSYVAGLRYPNAAKLRQLTVPTLAAAGKTDNVLGHLDQLAAAAANCQKVVTPGSLTPEAAAASAKIFGDFLDR